mmetsp:Transcript_106818/g.308984  ORF Transcript_106818/g.308984 Transcript_106818/m.308984 type:complete len:221 (+) Transcript_106818:66-728(+)
MSNKACLGHAARSSPLSLLRAVAVARRARSGSRHRAAGGRAPLGGALRDVVVGRRWLQPHVIQGAGYGDAALGALPQKRLHEMLGICAHVLPSGAVECPTALANVEENLALGAPADRHVAAEHEVCDDAEAPNVASLVVLPADDLWRHVPRRAHHVPQFLAIGTCACHAEVDDLQRTALGNGRAGHGEDDVLGLQVPVNNAMLMHSLHARQDLVQEAASL